MSVETEKKDLSNLGFTQRPKRKSFSIVKGSVMIAALAIVIFIAVSLQQGWVTVQFHFGDRATTSVQQEETTSLDAQRVERVLPPSENETIASLREEIELAFLDQVEEYFSGGENLEEKVDRYETLMKQLGKAYYDHYVTQGYGTLDDAHDAMEEYILNFEVEGVTLSQDSVEFYQQYIVEG